MQEEEIAEKIGYILEPISKSPPLFYSPKSTDGSGRGVREFSNEHVELLLQLASRIETEAGKDFFWQLVGHNFLWPILKNLSVILSSVPKRKALALTRKHCDIAAMVYIKAERTDEVLNGLLERTKDYDSINEPNIKVISCLYQVSFCEPYLFSDDQLKKIEMIVEKFQDSINKVHSLEKKLREQAQERTVQLPESLSELLGISVGHTPPPLPSSDQIRRSNNLVYLLRNVLSTIRFERVKEELRGVSSAINQDKKLLIHRYGELGLSKDLIEALERIDIETEETGSKFKFSQSIGFVRKIYEESLRELAIKICDRTGKPITKWTDRGKMGEAIDYFKHVRFITDQEGKLLGGFSALISDTGSHSLTSERYEVRIAKNILVEICSYLLGKIDIFVKNFAKDKLSGSGAQGS